MTAHAAALQDEIDLPQILVDVVEPGARAKRGWLACEIGSGVEFSMRDLESYCFAAWEPVVYDAMLVAAAVEYADKTQHRPALLWQRDITLRIPVHELQRWHDPQVIEALTNALVLLTGDCWTIQFYARRKAETPPTQRQFALPANVKAVIPFSDGLDSCAVAGLTARTLGDTLVRVRLGTKGYDGRSASGRPHPFTSIPYRLRAGKRPFAESSARSRGFKFALISGLAAYLAKADSVIVPESGQGALGPALVTVGQGYEDYRSHPLFTTLMQRFLFALLGHTVRYNFPRLWHTKAETLKAFVETCDNGEVWAKTWSCWQQNRHVSVAGVKRHCGICAACQLRRLSVHAAGLSEPPTVYVWENLGVAKFREGAAREFPKKKITSKLRDYAIAGTLHLDHLAGLRASAANAGALNLSAFQLGRSLGLSQDDARTRLDRLLRQHESEWKSFVQAQGRNSFIADWAVYAS
jgi:7-cyano-7-deazaguanine synthase in queuosine biosynthesis